MNNPNRSKIDALFSLVNREVWLVTAAAPDGRRGGLVATWVSQASIDPQRPVVVAGIAPNHFTAELIEASGVFAAHLIAADQIELAWRFGLTSARDRDKFEGLATTTAVSGAPILPGTLAWLDCRVIAKYDAGDRWFYWADVLSGNVSGSGAPLCERELFAAATAEQRAALAANRDADIAALRPLAEAWRRQLPPHRR